MKILLLSVLAITMIGLMVPSAFAYTITDDATGGDCSTFGIWYPSTRTCELAFGDLSEGITFGSSNIILEGNDRTVHHPYQTTRSSEDIGILLNAKTNIVIRNITVENFYTGIKLVNSFNNVITNSKISSNLHEGIDIDTGSDNNLISESDIGGNGGYGIDISSGESEITNNTINGNEVGIGCFSSCHIHGNTIKSNLNSGIDVSATDTLIEKNNISQNTVSSNGYGIMSITSSNLIIKDNLIKQNQRGIIALTPTEIIQNKFESNGQYGLQVTGSGSQVYHNNFLNNGLSVSESNSSVIFSPSSTTGGNYWSDYSTSCSNTNNDNFCDDPYPFSGGTINVHDDYVWTIPYGWLTSISLFTDGTILEVADPSGINYSYSNSVSFLQQHIPNEITHMLSVSCNPASGSLFPIGITEIICTASNGFKSTFPITINLETTPPVLTVPNDMTLSLLESETESIVEFTITATDNFAVTAGPTCSIESGTAFQIGTTTVTCTASDAAGNVGTGSFTVSVVEYDSISPTISVPSDMTLVENGVNAGGVGIFSVTASDNIGVVSGPTCSHTSGDTFAVGTTTVTCTAEDANGNVGTGSFTISVTEYVAPSEPEPEPQPQPEADTVAPQVLVPENIIVNSDVTTGEIVTFNPTAIDNVDELLVPTCSPQSGSLFPVGETTVICTAIDAAGNANTNSFTVTIDYKEFAVPNWVKDVAGFWYADDIDDASFLQGIQYLIQNDVIVVPVTESESEGGGTVPAWVKNNAGWWSQGAITDADFVNGIQFLIKDGLIQIN